MNKITSIHLNGKAFQLEARAYDQLQEYLKKAEAKLADNPDRQEILADLEQAIADKCGIRLGGSKDVVTAQEMDDILSQMGPVEAAADGQDGEAENDPAAAGGRETAPGVKRLYAIPDGAVIAGVCKGVAAYLNWDVTLVRVLAVAAIFLTHGAAILVYIIMALLLPEARTSGQIAEATGKPLTARDIVENGQQRLQEVSRSVNKTRAGRRILWIILVGIIVLLFAAIIGGLLRLLTHLFFLAWPW